MNIIFWISLWLIVYTFAGYGLLLYLLVLLKRLIRRNGTIPSTVPDLPTVTLVIAAYNEAEIIAEKIANSLALRYPRGKLKILFVSDGSTDGTDRIISAHQEVQLLHSGERKGKIHAIHRAMASVDTDIVVFTDANAFLNSDALLLIAQHYENPEVGAVSGEKRVFAAAAADATAGEGFYWKYESMLKKWDSELCTVVGAAGELFSIRRSLYQPLPEDTVLDDFMISMRIASQGYKVVYEPGAYASEHASANVQEEWKRKVRIAAGGIQSVIRLRSLLQPLKHPLLTFQYISHRVLRWTITPFLLPVCFILNMLMVLNHYGLAYQYLFGAQCLFYLFAFTGYLLAQKALKLKVFFIPYYFCLMNAAVMQGIYRYFFDSKRQTVLWDKAARKVVLPSVSMIDNKYDADPKKAAKRQPFL